MAVSTGSRAPGRPTVEGCRTLSRSHLLRAGFLEPNCRVAGSLVWTNPATGEQTASMRCETRQCDTSFRIRLVYTATNSSNGEKHRLDYSISLESTPQRLGGRRWWMICPVSGERVTSFTCPKAVILLHRARLTVLGIGPSVRAPGARLFSGFQAPGPPGGQGGIGTYIDKPKGMHQATFERKLAQVVAAEDVVNAHGALLLARLSLGRYR